MKPVTRRGPKRPYGVPKYTGPLWIGKPITNPPIEAGPNWIGKRIPFRHMVRHPDPGDAQGPTFRSVRALAKYLARETT